LTQSPDQSEWLQRVLGFTLPQDAATSTFTPAASAAAPSPESSNDTRTIWREAKDEVDDKLNALAAALRQFDDPDMERIADFGLFGVTKGESVALMKALMDFETTPAERRATKAAPLQKAISGFRAVLTGHPFIGQIDNNPFGVTVAMRSTLGAALDQIERSIG
jgi:hypothetical protein